MENVIDFSKHKIEKDENLLADFLRELGADEELIEFAVAKQKEILARNRKLGELGTTVTVSFPGSVSDSDREDLASQINHVLEEYNAASSDLITNLTSRLLLTEIRLFQSMTGRI